MKNNLRNVVFTTMIGLCTFQIGVIFKQNQVNQVRQGKPGALFWHLSWYADGRGGIRP